VKATGIQQVLSAPRSLWQRAYVERVIGTMRRECLDHMMVFGEGSLYRHLKTSSTTITGAGRIWHWRRDSPEPRPVQPPGAGRIIAIPEVGGLHHRHERRAAETAYSAHINSGRLCSVKPLSPTPHGHVPCALRFGYQQ